MNARRASCDVESGAPCRLSTLSVVNWSVVRPHGATRSVMLASSRKADVSGEIANTPVTLKGTASIAQNGSQTVQAIDLDVKVNVPLIGKKIEPFVVDALRNGLQKEHELGRDWTH